MNTLLIQIVAAVAIFLAGSAAGIKWHAGQDAIAAQAAAKAREKDIDDQRKAGDKAAFRQADRLATINNQLGDARGKIARLSGRECLSADTVGLLNSIGADPVRTTASEPAGMPAAAAADQGLRFATDSDTADAIAICRAKYTGVSGQLNEILDLEERRHPPAKE